jgi:hypothetical protein
MAEAANPKPIILLKGALNWKGLKVVDTVRLSDLSV